MSRNTKPNRRNTESIQEIDKLIKEAKEMDKINETPSCFINCSKKNCDCKLLNVYNFLKFIGKEQEEVFGVILANDEMSDDFKTVSYSYAKLIEYIMDLWNEDISDSIPIIESLSKKSRNKCISERIHNLPDEFPNMIESELSIYKDLNEAYKEFKNFKVTRRTALFYLNIVSFNDTIDENSKTMSEKAYLSITNSNCKIIDILSKCCKKLLTFQILKYVVETLNK